MMAREGSEICGSGKGNEVWLPRRGAALTRMGYCDISNCGIIIRAEDPLHRLSPDLVLIKQVKQERWPHAREHFRGVPE